MSRSAPALAATLLLALACCRGDDAPPPAEPDPTPSAPAPQPIDRAAALTTMRNAIAQLQQRAEKADERVVVRHILVAFRGTIDGVGRTRDEAEALAAELYTRAVLHEDFDALRQRFSDDKTSGRYEIEKSGRRGFVKNFGDVAFRLQRGEIGIAPWHETDGEFGWHVIERLQ